MLRVLLILALTMTTLTVRAATCPVGEYLNNDVCNTCPTKAYCPGDDAAYECNNLWGGDTSDVSLIWTHTTTTDNTTPEGYVCVFQVLTPNATATYEIWTGKCDTDPSEFGGIEAIMCRTGYYATNVNILMGMTVYEKCIPCTNGPANTIYTSYGFADQNDCPWKCGDGYRINSDGTGCDKLCAQGFTSINVANGVSVPLYNERRTSPAINIGDVGAVCYADLAPGRATGAINVLWQDAIYHTVSPTTTLKCDAGYYLDDNGGCAPCYETHFCPGDNTRVSCTAAIIDDPDYPTPIVYAESRPRKYTAPEQCRCQWKNLSDERRSKYLIIGQCYLGPAGGRHYVAYSWCRVGYYAIQPHGPNQWYRDCAPCTNGPENSHYTSYSTPSVISAVESNCPWECNAGYVLVDGKCIAE